MSVKYYKLKNTEFVFIIIALFFIGFMVGLNFSPTKIIKEEVVKYRMPNLSTIREERTIEILVPAVDENGEGVGARLITRVRPALSPGYGMMLVSINDVLAQYDTQLSARIAAKAAEKYTSMDLTDFDIIYTIEADTSVVEGPSAGAAMAISVVAALQNSTVASDVTITGTIDEDGIIGPAGSVIDKAKEAKKEGITTFLVSDGLPPQHEIDRATNCWMIDKVEYCEVAYIPKEIDLEKEISISIKQVTNLEEALGYFIE